MTKKEKRLQKMRQNRKNVSFDTLISVLQDYGFEIRQGKGSHVHVRVQIEDRVWYDTIVKPHGKNKFVNPKSVKKALEAIDEIIALQEGETDSEEDSENT